MSNPDQIQRFLFEDIDVRGVLVGLHDSFSQVLARHDYPAAVSRMLGEMLAAASLLSSTLKFDGRLSLQAKGEGAVSLLMVECSHQHQVRGIARWQGEVADDASFRALMERGQLVITIEPDHGQRYQGIVPLERESLAACLEDYFSRSEQLATTIHLQVGEGRASGMLLQALPGKPGAVYQENWERIVHLGATLSGEELLALDNETLLYRLFHEEQVRLFDGEPLQFACDCSRERSARALKTLGRKELELLIQQQKQIHIDCQFCNERYQFDGADVALMFSGNAQPADDTVH